MASPSIDDPRRDDTIIVQNFMEELCRRDNENKNTDPNRLNIFTVEEIWLAVLRAFSLERVRVTLDCINYICETASIKLQVLLLFYESIFSNVVIFLLNSNVEF